MEEFEALLQRSHKAGLKVIIDFVPNHVARQYKSVKKPDGVKDFGETDDVNKGFYPDNNFYYCPNESFAPYFDLKVKQMIHIVNILPRLPEMTISIIILVLTTGMKPLN